MSSLVIRDARVLTMGSAPGVRRGGTLGQLGVIDRADVLIEGERIAEVGQGLEADAVIEAAGRVLMPAFVDAHTHLCWAGDRLDEWEAKLAGAGYLELLAAGGGIMSTVRSVRAATDAELARDLARKLGLVAREGTCAIEIKSGYGLSTEAELKMLRAIRLASDAGGIHISPTACIGHAIDPDVVGFVEMTVHDTLPAISESFPGIAVDAYCEEGAWSLADTRKLLEAARSLGHPLRLHADQFHSLGGVEAAVELGALSVDHLEASSKETLGALAESETFGVMLPCSGFHVDGRYADGRTFVDQGGKLVIATNANPGSAPCWSPAMAIALAVRHLGITAAEAIGAFTVNAAELLGLTDRGRIAPNMRADVVLLPHFDERELGRSFGGRQTDAVILGGRVVG